jgi:hypothetical protein
MGEDFGKCSHNFFVPVIESSGATDPEEVFRLSPLDKKICHYRDFNFAGFHIFFSFFYK